MKYIHDSELPQIIAVETTSKLVVIKFTADWCAPCRALNPILEQLEKFYKDKVYIYNINVDNNPISTTNFGIKNIPTLIYFKNGQEVARTTGSVSKAELMKNINQYL